MKVPKIALVFVGTWLASSVAFSKGSIAPELPIIMQAKSSAEYPLLRRLQDLTLELQLVELTIKNRRDPQIESKISQALKEIEKSGNDLAKKFKVIHADQLAGLEEVIDLAKNYGPLLGISKIQWEELKAALKDGTISAGNLTVLKKAGPLNLIELSPLSIDRQVVWSVSLPTIDRNNFWVQARSKARAAGQSANRITETALKTKLEKINLPYISAEKLAKEYFTGGYEKLYSAFEEHRYAILQRITLARKALMELSKNNGAMGTPEEYAALYNQVLDNLFSYGVDMSLSGIQRDFAVRGFLFARSPDDAQDLLQKLKYSPSAGSYNSPSS